MMAFEAYYSKWRLAAFALLGLGFAAMGAWIVGLLGSGAEDASLVVKIAGWGCLTMGLAVPFITIGQALHSGPAIRIDQTGIFWHRWSSSVIPWSNVSRVEPYSINSQKMVGITLIDRNLNKKQGILGKLSSANRAMGFGDLALTVQGTDRKFDEMLEALLRHADSFG
jgi:hypothetical protein